jgi:hypothetical protein
MRRMLPLVGVLPKGEGSAALGRRELVKWIGAVTAARVLPGCSSSSGAAAPVKHPPPPPPPPFLSTKQQNALAALADYVLPPDQEPGGAALGVVSYVEGALTALEGATPKVFAGGPYSGREPFATPVGTPSSNFPEDDFTSFVPLDRYRLAAWKLRLLGSDGVDGGGINDAVIGKTIGWQTQVTTALDAAITAASAPLDATSPAAVIAEAWGALTPGAKAFLTELVIEGSFSSPEYGGNKSLAGFKLCNFEGDVQPLGYSLYDETIGAYKELPDAPVSTANPGPDPAPLDDMTRNLIKTLATVTGGKVYF